ncbi:TonB-dependent receptor [Zavarzinia compransoris]|uniref:TonB-dependent receptor n=1 Tax=Zavarzinia compransoris TaxID=1264899 RepID=A0A317DWC6_9PROT|nr:TonB-dependent receptor [Zavarzinia compransoris]PWR18260.1 hypothetical protein DKG75_20025 [Zavarzinia compransoris]TDP43684.1 iron complex outermembrane receptor protein [Zavarzinia compransoris]
MAKTANGAHSPHAVIGSAETITASRLCCRPSGLAMAVWLGAAFLAAGAQAEEAGQERATATAEVGDVLVTAQRYNQDLQSTPVSVSAIGWVALEERQVTTLKGLGAQVPGLVVESVTALQNAPRIFLRGVGQDSATFNVDPAVGTYVDFVYYPRLYGAVFDFADVERVEVLRGPQGTLYGRNTSGGAINVVTKRPSQVPTGSIEVSYGSYNQFDINGFISAPIVPNKLAASLAVIHRQRDGITFASNQNTWVNDRNYTAERLKLLFTPTDDLEFELSADNVNDDSGPFYPAGVPTATGVVGDIFATGSTLPSDSNSDTWGISLTGRYKLQDWTLSSISAYRNLDYGTIIANHAVANFALTSGIYVDNYSLSQEFNATYQGKDFTAVGGLFYFQEHTDFEVPVGSNPKEHSIQDTYNYAAYGQVTYHLTDRLGLIGGLRYTRDTKDLWNYYYEPTPAVPVRYPLEGSRTWDGLTPKLGIEFQATPEFFTYATFTSGFKAGGWNRIGPTVNSGQLIYSLFDFDPENVNAYEIGGKYQSPDKRFVLNVAGYVNDVTDLHVTQQIQGTTVGRTTNASAARILGLELETSFKITPELLVYGNLAVTDAEYTETFLCANPAGAYEDCSDKDLKSVSPLKALVGFTYQPPLDIPGSIKLGASLSHTAKYYNDAYNREVGATDAYQLLNASITYLSEDGHWTATLEGKNLTDEHYYGTTLIFGATTLVYPNDPLTVTARLGYAF